MDKRFVTGFALLVSSTSAFAQTATTPTVVATPDPTVDQVAPWIARKGNLRLSIACADSMATPDDGLAVAVDGAPLDSRALNGNWSSYTDNDGNTGDAWNASDTGYLLAPGHHHVQIDAPGCAPSTFDVDSLPDHATRAVGRLVLDDWSLKGPVGAPNGFGVTFGMWFAPVPSGPSTNSIFNQSATYDGGTTATGAYVSFSHERRNLVVASDFAFAGGPTSGVVSEADFNSNPSSQRFTGSTFVSTDQLRVGARLPLQDVALEAGSGVGLSWWVRSTSIVGDQTSLFAPDGIDGTFYLPLWAGATIKPTCNWGLQVMGQYDVHPTSMDTNGFELAAGVMYQPSDSCSDTPGVRVN
jgi:hypothetical protein